jgi:hypothetical protein
MGELCKAVSIKTKICLQMMNLREAAIEAQAVGVDDLPLDTLAVCDLKFNVLKFRSPR